MISKEIFESIKDLIFNFGPKLVGAIVVFIIGLWLVKIVIKSFSKILDQRAIDSSLKPFLKSVIQVLLKVMLVISVLGMLGIEMTSFIAVLGAAGLAIGMALSGTLQNFAGGVIILIFKPYKVGDYITAQSQSGTVKEIQIFNTILKTPDNVTIIIPNGQLSNASMKNYSTEKLRRVDWKIGIAYGDDSDKAKHVLRTMLEGDERVLKDPAVFIALSELGDSSVNLAVRAWVKAEDFWAVFFDINEKVYKTFSKQGLHIPFPQMDVHLHQQRKEEN
jgi:small conductance mechanosensitive channel